MIEIYLIHPILVHFTIALFSLSVLFDILGKLTKKEGFHVAAWFNLLFAGFAVITTVISGLVAESRAPHTDAGHELLSTHATIGFIVSGIIVFLWVWRAVLNGSLPIKGEIIYFIIAILGVGLMFVGGYYGGEMVYTHGYGVKAVVRTTQYIHSEGETHEHGKTELEEHQKTMSDSTVRQQEKVHEHKDGVKHVH